MSPEGNAARNRADAREVRLPRVSIMPQVGPLARAERILHPDYVSGAMNSPLAPIHFRNQLKLHPELLSDFVTVHVIEASSTHQPRPMSRRIMAHERHA